MTVLVSEITTTDVCSAVDLGLQEGGTWALPRLGGLRAWAGTSLGKLPLGASASCPHQISLIWRSQNRPGLFQITGSPFSQTRSHATRNLIEPNLPSAALLPACAAAGARLGEQTSPSPLSAAADYSLQGLCPCNCSPQAKPAWHGRVPEPMLSIHHAQEPEQPMLLYTLSLAVDRRLPLHRQRSMTALGSCTQSPTAPHRGTADVARLGLLWMALRTNTRISPAVRPPSQS
ncbi:hypothetical protein MRS44_006490 [Fusarium solani]|uniref:uncharacterized protein n=1 Tax=Fusarium solani TaxID=169388 RepID=UPI0032C4A349|nr:hypothetical protein MRS44_006490 [Fusarium solani]